MKPFGWTLLQSDKGPYKKRISGHSKRHQISVYPEERPHAETGRDRPSTSQGERPQKKPTLVTPWPWSPGFQNEKMLKPLTLWLCYDPSKPVWREIQYLTGWNWGRSHIKHGWLADGLKSWRFHIKMDRPIPCPQLNYQSSMKVTGRAESRGKALKVAVMPR